MGEIQDSTFEAKLVIELGVDLDTDVAVRSERKAFVLGLTLRQNLAIFEQLAVDPHVFSLPLRARFSSSALRIAGNLGPSLGPRTGRFGFRRTRLPLAPGAGECPAP